MKYALALILLTASALGASPATYLGLLVAYQDGKIVAAQAMGMAPNMSECMKGLEEALTEITPKSGVSIVPFCTPAPDVPSAHKGDTST